MIRFLVIVGCFIVVACKTTKISSTNQRGGYHEDLSVYRPQVEVQEVQQQSAQQQTTEPVGQRDPKEFVEAKYSVNKQLDAVLDSIDRLNLTRRFIDGYTIQVYFGANQKDALNARKELIGRMPDVESSLDYVQPNFKVRAGKYFTRLEAQSDYAMIKKLFPAAIVIPDKIQIK